MFKWLENEDLIYTNPFSKFDLKIKVPKRLPGNVKVNELKQMAQPARACAAQISIPGQNPRKETKGCILIVTTAITVSIESRELSKGSLPNKQRRLVLAWAELRREELMANWNLLMNGEEPFKIQPLR